MWHAVLSWLRDLLAGVGLCESNVDRKVREAQAAFQSAMTPAAREDSSDE